MHLNISTEILSWWGMLPKQMWSFSVDIICGHSVWILSVDIICGHSVWTLFVDILCGHYLGHYLWSIFQALTYPTQICIATQLGYWSWNHLHGWTADHLHGWTGQRRCRSLGWLGGRQSYSSQDAISPPRNKIMMVIMVTMMSISVSPHLCKRLCWSLWWLWCK